MEFKTWFERQDTGYWPTHPDDPELNALVRTQKYRPPKLPTTKKSKKIDKKFGRSKKN